MYITQHSILFNLIFSVMKIPLSFSSLIKSMTLYSNYIVSPLQFWRLWTSLLLFRETLWIAINDFWCFGAKSMVVRFVRHMRALNYNSRNQKVVGHNIFIESMILQILMFLCISLTCKQRNKKGCKPITYVSRVMLTNHTTTVVSTSSLSFQQILLQKHECIYIQKCSEHTDYKQSPTKTYFQCKYCNN